MRRSLLIATLGLCLAPAIALAQDTIDYQGHEIELSSQPVQCLVWERDETRHEDPDGVSQTATVVGVIFVDDMENGWIVGGRVQRDATGAWDLKVGDSCDDAMGTA